MAEKKEISARIRALRLLNRRAYTELELSRKLRMAGHAVEEIEPLLAEFRNLGYLNDEFYAEDYSRNLASRNLGSRGIRMKLQQKGLPEELIEQSIRSLEDDEETRARQALEGKLRMLSGEKDPRKRKEKCFRFLASRGFSPDVIFPLLSSALEK